MECNHWPWWAWFGIGFGGGLVTVAGLVWLAIVDIAGSIGQALGRAFGRF